MCCHGSVRRRFSGGIEKATLNSVRSAKPESRRGMPDSVAVGGQRQAGGHRRLPQGGQRQDQGRYAPERDAQRRAGGSAGLTHPADERVVNSFAAHAMTGLGEIDDCSGLNSVIVQSVVPGPSDAACQVESRLGRLSSRRAVTVRRSAQSRDR